MWRSLFAVAQFDRLIRCQKSCQIVVVVTVTAVVDAETAKSNHHFKNCIYWDPWQYEITKTRPTNSLSISLSLSLFLSFSLSFSLSLSLSRLNNTHPLSISVHSALSVFQIPTLCIISLSLNVESFAQCLSLFSIIVHSYCPLFCLFLFLFISISVLCLACAESNERVCWNYWGCNQCQFSVAANHWVTSDVNLKWAEAENERKSECRQNRSDRR